MRTLLTLLAAVALIVAPGALAQNDPSTEVYGGQGTNVTTTVDQGQTTGPGQVTTTSGSTVTEAPGTTTTGGTLPVTGQDLTILLIGGLLLVAVGFGLHRLSRGSGRTG